MISSTAPTPAGVGITAADITDSDVIDKESNIEISFVPNRIKNGIQYQKHSFAKFFNTMEISDGTSFNKRDVDFSMISQLSSSFFNAGVSFPLLLNLRTIHKIS